MYIIPLTMTDSLQRLKTRRKQIAQDIGSLNEQIIVLEIEDKELEAAEAVLARFADDSAESHAKDTAQSPSPPTGREGKTGRHPDDAGNDYAVAF